MKRQGLTILIGLLIALNVAFPARALEADFSVGPSRIDLMIKPGQKVTTTFTITNHGDPQTFVPRVMNAAPDPAGGTLALSKSTKSPVTFTFKNGKPGIGDPVFLKSNENVSIPVTIETTTGEQKDYYFYFLVEAQSRGVSEGTTAVNVVPRIGAPLIVTLTDIAEREVKSEISVFKVDADFSLALFGRQINMVETGNDVPVLLTVTNTGSNFVNPQGSITVTDMLGRSAEHQLVPRNVYAHSNRLILTPSSYEQKCAEGSDECRRSTLTLNGILFGQYTVTAAVDPGNGGSKSFKSVSFVVLPFRLIFGLLIFSLLYVLVIRRVIAHPRKSTRQSS